MNVSKRPSMFRTRKGNALTKAQKQVKAKSKKTTQLKNEMFSTDTKGIGKYARKSDRGLSRRQSYKLEKKALNNEALKINAKPEMIRAVGSAIARSTAAPAASAGASIGVTAGNKIGSLINGGVGKSGVDNEEEINEAENQMPNGYIVR